MSFTITINERKVAEGPDGLGPPREIYQQTVDELDLLTLINTINRKKRKPRERKAKVAA